jgi:hypothetical protein
MQNGKLGRMAALLNTNAVRYIAIAGAILLVSGCYNVARQYDGPWRPAADVGFIATGNADNRCMMNNTCGVQPRCPAGVRYGGYILKQIRLVGECDGGVCDWSSVVKGQSVSDFAVGVEALAGKRYILKVRQVHPHPYGGGKSVDVVGDVETPTIEGDGLYTICCVAVEKDGIKKDRFKVIKVDASVCGGYGQFLDLYPKYKKMRE